jgi:hypothetical protein
MKIIIDAGGTYTDFCCPHPPTGSGIFQSTEGLGFSPDASMHLRPIPRVLCMFPGVDPTQLIHWLEARGADVSWYSGPAYFTTASQVQDIIALTEANLSQNRYIIAPIDPNYRYYLEQKEIDYAIVHPDKSMKLVWHRLLRNQPGNRPGDLKGLFSEWDKTIQELENVSTHTLAQRFRVKIKNKVMYVEGVPEYLKPESSRCKMYLDSFHDNYDLASDFTQDGRGGVWSHNKEPIYQINGEVYGRAKEHQIKLMDVK